MTRYPINHLATALLLGLCLIAAITALPAKETEYQQTTVSLSITPEKDAVVASESKIQPAKAAESHNAHTFIVAAGDNLSLIFNRAGLSPRTLHEIISIGPEVAVLSRIKPGESLTFELDETGELQHLRYDISPLKKLHVDAVATESKPFAVRWETQVPEVIQSYRNVRITQEHPSLYHAGKAAGLSDKLIMSLANIFQWDISFALDLRQGDSFTLIFEELYLDGEKMNDGEILGARFNNLGKTYTALRHADGNREEYFSPDGRSLRKAFLRDPVHFSHVSSSFNLRRLHPIHNRVMPHRGIDYAANKGTPVVAAGDGNVKFARRNKASGRYVVIQHGEQYTTKYLHLSGFAKGIRAGKPVKQGQTIGYVGATGWATAPHLHYEFLVNGAHRNPRTVKLPKADPIARKSLTAFKTGTAPMLARLDSLSGRTMYAAAKSLESDGE